jgi:hypothetical protein
MALSLTGNPFSRAFACAGLFALSCAAQSQPFRPPAVPLVAHDPYFSIWSMADHLNDEGTKHWTGKPNSLTAFVRVDGKSYQVMGRERPNIAVIHQDRVEVLPTRTLYDFSGAGIKLNLTFLTPALPKDLDILARPVTYLDWTVSSSDGSAHSVQLYFDASNEVVVNTPDQPVILSRYLLDGQPVLRIGSKDQPILGKRGDDLRIDWGYLYLMADRREGLTTQAAMHATTVAAFLANGKLADSDDMSDRTPPRRGIGGSIAAALDLGQVSGPVSRYFLLAYDDIYGIEYFERRERSWWRRNGAEISDLLKLARQDHDSLLARSKAFDEELMGDLRKVGGERYARLASLAYRQTIAAHKLVADVDGTAMWFPKENFSNGCIATVDVIYPSAPFTLLFSPALVKAQLAPVLDYSRMSRWKWPFAPHDLGTYPWANGQVYGGGERTEENQMPVEESGNMLILLAALAKVEGNADFSARYWPELTKWADYLLDKGLDPENQLSTDDFAGHLAHNANLSIKAIVALGSYSRLAEMTGHQSEAARYRAKAQEFAKKFVEMGQDGDHYRLAFDKPGTWSQKYNLVWDKLLKLNLFPASVTKEEIAFYKTKENKFGLPLDNRKDYTKLDWLIWTATLADNRADFENIADYGYKFADEGDVRVPLGDWYGTVKGEQIHFQARSVVGGIFIKMLDDPAIWSKYAK